MKGRQIILDHFEGREAAALMVDGRLEDFLIAYDAPRPGTIYRAVAQRPMKGQGGVIVTTPDGPGFLRQIKGIAPGDTLLVQVTGYAEDGKALPVSEKALFKSRYAIVTPDAPGLNISRAIRDDDRRDELMVIAKEEMAGCDYGLILRSACFGADDGEIAEDIAAMRALAEEVFSAREGEAAMLSQGDNPHVMAWRDWSEPADVVTEAGGFEHCGVLDALAALEQAESPLPGGGSLFVEPTRALVAVDVNTGGDTSLAAGLKANLATAQALPRQLRLRGLGGQIVIDLAPMPKKDRRGFEAALRKALRADGVDTVLAGFTPLGHYELQRKRARLPLHEVLG
ncbi:ribonuclease E/G [Rhodobacteraceae bacterium D3-12]|nr:ribonuclease E/G [Rhodobacteraceae bacterium D3-12]